MQNKTISEKITPNERVTPNMTKSTEHENEWGVTKYDFDVHMHMHTHKQATHLFMPDLNDRSHCSLLT